MTKDEEDQLINFVSSTELLDEEIWLQIYIAVCANKAFNHTSIPTIQADIGLADFQARFRRERCEDEHRIRNH